MEALSGKGIYKYDCYANVSLCSASMWSVTIGEESDAAVAATIPCETLNVSPLIGPGTSYVL